MEVADLDGVEPLQPHVPPRATGDGVLGGMLAGGLSQGVRIFLSLISTIIVSRLLTPDDYGVLAMVAPLLTFVTLFQGLGLAPAVIRATTLPANVLDALFWVTMLSSLGVCAAVAFGAPLIGWFYHDCRPAYVAIASIALVLMNGSGLLHAALLNRQMRFAALARVEIFAVFAQFLATMGSAFALRTYWAILLGQGVGSAVLAASLWRLEPWRPRFAIRMSDARAELRFGGGLTGFNLANFVSRNADTVLIARVAGAQQLGLYDRSYQFMMLPLSSINAPLTRVMLPVLAQLRHAPQRHRRAFLRSTYGILLLTTPGIAVMIATSARLVAILLGPHWTAAAPIFFWLSLTALLQPVANVTGWLFITSGRSGAMMRWGIVSGIVTVVGFAIGIHWAAVGVAASLFVTTAFRLPFLFSYCTGGTEVTFRDLVKAQCVSVACAGAIVGGLALLPPVSSIWSLVAVLAGAYVASVPIFAVAAEGRDVLRVSYGQGARALLKLRREGSSRATN
jgi:PST family polysaccharide transporter